MIALEHLNLHLSHPVRSKPTWGRCCKYIFCVTLNHTVRYLSPPLPQLKQFPPQDGNSYTWDKVDLPENTSLYVLTP